MHAQHCVATIMDTGTFASPPNPPPEHLCSLSLTVFPSFSFLIGSIWTCHILRICVWVIFRWNMTNSVAWNIYTCIFGKITFIHASLGRCVPVSLGWYLDMESLGHMVHYLIFKKPITLFFTIAALVFTPISSIWELNVFTCLSTWSFWLPCPDG